MPDHAEMFVAFIDVLGFKNILNDWDRAVRFYETVKSIARWQRDATSSILSQLHSQGLGRIPEGTLKIISDSIILAHPNAEQIIFRVLQISGMLLDFGVVARGCIAYGRHLEDLEGGDFAVVSEALSRAYVAEQQRANFPRILLHESILKTIKEQWLTGDGRYHLMRMGKVFAQGEDNEWFLDPYGAADANLAAIHAFLDRAYFDSESPRIREKYKWLLDFLYCRLFAGSAKTPEQARQYYDDVRYLMTQIAEINKKLPIPVRYGGAGPIYRFFRIPRSMLVYPDAISSWRDFNPELMPSTPFDQSFDANRRLATYCME
jgi:hypothetical protein